MTSRIPPSGRFSTRFRRRSPYPRQAFSDCAMSPDDCCARIQNISGFSASFASLQSRRSQYVSGSSSSRAHISPNREEHCPDSLILDFQTTIPTISRMCRQAPTQLSICRIWILDQVRQRRLQVSNLLGLHRRRSRLPPSRREKSHIKKPNSSAPFLLAPRACRKLFSRARPFGPLRPWSFSSLSWSSRSFGRGDRCCLGRNTERSSLKSSRG